VLSLPIGTPAPQAMRWLLTSLNSSATATELSVMTDNERKSRFS